MLEGYFKRYDFLLGSDEVGRGCVAGPVVCCTVKTDCTSVNFRKLKRLELRDSKKLSKKKRVLIVKKLLGDKLYDHATHIKSGHLKNYTYTYSISRGLSACLTAVSPQFIDRKNILRASLYGMKFSGLKLLSDEDHRLNGCWIFDGNQLPKIRKSNLPRLEAIIRADETLSLVSLASVIAKEFRDTLMASIGEHFPEYYFEKHFGYLTKDHKKALKVFGPTKHHRYSFKGVT